MSDIRKLHKLYRKIPTFRCNPGCTDCCGPVPFAKIEWDLVIDKRKPTSLSCPYGVNGECDIYEQRPIICRLFGAVDTDKLACPHGCGPETKLSDKESSEIMAEYIEKFMNG